MTKEKKTGQTRAPKRTYLEIQRANREAEIKAIAKVKQREDVAFQAYEAIKAERVSREGVLNAPLDPDMGEVVAGIVARNDVNGHAI